MGCGTSTANVQQAKPPPPEAAAPGVAPRAAPTATETEGPLVAHSPKVPAAAPMAAAAVPAASHAEELAPASVSSPVFAAHATQEAGAKKVEDFVLLMKSKEALRMMCWDLGGQDTFYGLHHLYISRQGVYAVTFNMEGFTAAYSPAKQDQRLAFLSFWLSSTQLPRTLRTRLMRLLRLSSSLARTRTLWTHQRGTNASQPCLTKLFVARRRGLACTGLQRRRCPRGGAHSGSSPSTTRWVTRTP